MAHWLTDNIADFDVIHVHGLWNVPLLLTAKAARERKKRFVISPHGMADAILVKRHLEHIKKLYLLALIKTTRYCAACYHYTSQSEATNSVLESPEYRKPNFIIPNAIEDQWFSEPEADVPSPERLEHQPYILFVGRFSWKKQVEKLTKAFLGKLNQHNDVILVLAGPDDEGYGKKIRRMAEEAKASQRILILPPQEGLRLRALYRNATVFVSPAISENFGYTVIEALASGTPVIASTGVGGLSIGGLDSCVYTISPDANDLAEALIRVLADHHKWKKKAEYGASIVKQHFCINSVGLNLEQQYNQMLD
jgi:glycosyltransferase involved in cell wall biosynthesis